MSGYASKTQVLVLAAAAAVAPVPPLATGTALPILRVTDPVLALAARGVVAVIADTPARAEAKVCFCNLVSSSGTNVYNRVERHR